MTVPDEKPSSNSATPAAPTPENKLDLQMFGLSPHVFKGIHEMNSGRPRIERQRRGTEGLVNLSAQQIRALECDPYAPLIFRVLDLKKAVLEAPPLFDDDDEEEKRMQQILSALMDVQCALAQATDDRQQAILEHML